MKVGLRTGQARCLKWRDCVCSMFRNVRAAWRFVPLELKIMLVLFVLLSVLGCLKPFVRSPGEFYALLIAAIIVFAVMCCVYAVLVYKGMVRVVRHWREKPEHFRDECDYFVQEVHDALVRMGSHCSEGRTVLLCAAGKGVGPVSLSEKAWLTKRYIEIWYPEVAPLPRLVLRILSVAVPIAQFVISVYGPDGRQELLAAIGDSTPSIWTVGVTVIVLIMWLLSIIYRRKRFVVTTAMRLRCERQLGGVDRHGAISK